MKLAIYCFTMGDGEESRMRLQEERGRKYASLTRWTDQDCEIYRDATPAILWADRLGYERLKRDISDGKIGEVWANEYTLLHPLNERGGSFDALCKSKNVKIRFGIKSDAQNALHEAGHAVAGYAFGIPIMEIDIIPDESGISVGHTLFAPYYNPQDTFGRFDLLIKDFCGYATEQKADFADLSGWLLTDRKNLESSIPELIRLGIFQEGEEKTFEEQLLRHARLFVEKNWTAIQKFAKVLEEKRQMSGTEAEQLCEALEVKRRQPGSQTERWSLP